MKFNRSKSRFCCFGECYKIYGNSYIIPTFIDDCILMDFSILFRNEINMRKPP